MATLKTSKKWEYGDFQTPDELAHQCVQVLMQRGITPASVIEPTCGRGAFLIQSTHAFPHAQHILGVEINSDYLDHLHHRLAPTPNTPPVTTHHADFFDFSWHEHLALLPEPFLILGNPPWVTNADLSLLKSNNLPAKSNLHGTKGMDALTGKSNFDISEWMLLQYLEWVRGRSGTIALLCKTSVARKVLAYAWKQNSPIRTATLYGIDAKIHFEASVDACFLVIEVTGERGIPQCVIYDNLSDDHPRRTIGYCDNTLIANLPLYTHWQFLRGVERSYTWRSGIKHDASKIMELERHNGGFRNGNQEYVSIEETYLYPMFKSSDISQGRIEACRKYMLVTQTTIGEATTAIEQNAPHTWAYLQRNAATLHKRASTIYQNRPPFSMFGVGSYTFAPWKVAISGFYKYFHFAIVGPIQGRPAVFDDTVYFVPCASQQETQFIADLLNSESAKAFFESMTFWDDKRPITIDLLKRLNLHALALYLGREAEYLSYTQRTEMLHQLSLEF